MAIEQIAIYLVIGLVAVSMLCILLFGIRAVAFGKVEPMKMIFLGFPFVLFAILGIVMPTWAEAGVYTLVVMIALAIGAMLFTSVKGVFR